MKIFIRLKSGEGFEFNDSLIREDLKSLTIVRGGENIFFPWENILYYTIKAAEEEGDGE